MAASRFSSISPQFLNVSRCFSSIFQFSVCSNSRCEGWQSSCVLFIKWKIRTRANKYADLCQMQPGSTVLRQVCIETKTEIVTAV